jgi:tRNA(Ile)-lysidine synthetase-like protein
MKVTIPEGKYIAAISGGVDSMVLLDLLSNLSGVELVAAYFDHGTRPDSAEDGLFVQRAAARYGLSFESACGELGENAGEAAARTARYDFLEKVRRKYGAAAVITAHHQDDLVETALINLLRGTGRRGLFSIKANRKILRPLLGYPKNEIIRYARENDIGWREDPTNAGDDYLRNYVRHNLAPKLSENQRASIIDNLDKVAKIDEVIQRERDHIEKRVVAAGEIDRSRFSGLPSEVGSEILVRKFRRLGVADIDRKTINRINASIRTARHNRIYPVKNGLKVEMTTETAVFRR